MEFPGQEYWSVLPFPSPGDLPDPGIKSEYPALQADSLPSEPPGKPNYICVCVYTYVCVYVWIYAYVYIYVVVIVQLLSCVCLFATPWTAACQASLSLTIL